MARGPPRVCLDQPCLPRGVSGGAQRRLCRLPRARVSHRRAPAQRRGRVLGVSCPIRRRLCRPTPARGGDVRSLPRVRLLRDGGRRLERLRTRRCRTSDRDAVAREPSRGGRSHLCRLPHSPRNACPARLGGPRVCAERPSGRCCGDETWGEHVGTHRPRGGRRWSPHAHRGHVSASAGTCRVRGRHRTHAMAGAKVCQHAEPRRDRLCAAPGAGPAVARPRPRRRAHSVGVRATADIHRRVVGGLVSDAPRRRTTAGAALGVCSGAAARRADPGPMTISPAAS